ncbi:mitochondrial PGP phosphatase-domain-containing protein [Morchella snyderi]|nr:mitochondrial PGP phosphatase-domain-containing protein [Morchella snyderi]
MVAFNLSATLNALRVLHKPTLLQPHLTIPTFADLPVPLAPHIRAVILDKDNCFAVPHALEVHPGYNEKFKQLKEAYPGGRLLIVSNSSGTTWDDPSGKEAAILEQNTGVTVLRHSTKKPGCHAEIFTHLVAADIGVTRPDQVAVVGDRLFTDVLMANLMGSYAVWVKEGVISPEKRFYGRVEWGLAGFMERRGWTPPTPSSRLLSVAGKKE